MDWISRLAISRPGFIESAGDVFAAIVRVVLLRR
jgi:hypothetical protein